MGDSRPDQDDHPAHHDPGLQPQMTMHPVSYPTMPMHMYPFPTSVGVPAPPPRTKRRQVKNACTNCQKACKKCDDARPCLRCVKYGISEECVDSQRKERQKGIKRGPYKKRDGKDRSVSNVDQQVDVSVSPNMVIPPAVAATSATPPIPYVTQYAPVYGQYPAPHVSKAGDTPMYVPQLFYAPIAAAQMSPGHAPGQEGEAPPGYAPTPYYPIFHAPYAQPYPPPYMMPAPRPEGQIPMAAMAHHHHHYAPYPQAYPKPPSRGPEMNGQIMDGRMDMRRDVRVDGARLGDGMQGNTSKSG